MTASSSLDWYLVVFTYIANMAGLPAAAFQKFLGKGLTRITWLIAAASRMGLLRMKVEYCSSLGAKTESP